MKLKGFILVAFFSIIAALSLSQFNVVSAQVQSAATSPITYFTYVLRGRITYRVLNWMFPATNMTVVAKNLQGETFSTKTDYTGFYTLSVKQTDTSVHYIIKPSDGQKTAWSPVQYKKMVSRDINGLNFVGTPASASSQISH